MINVPHIIETALLLLVAYLIGCVIGYGLRRLSAKPLPLVVDEPARPVETVASNAAPPATPVPIAAQPALARERSPAARLAMASPPEAIPAPVPAAPVDLPAPVAPVAQVAAAQKTKAIKPKPAPASSQAASKAVAAPMAKLKSADVPPKPSAKIVARQAPATVAPTPAATVKQRAPKPKAEPIAPAPAITLPATQPTAVAAPAKPAKPKVVTKPAPKPEAKAAPKPAAAKPAPKPPADPKPSGLKEPRAGGKDDLKLLKGIGPKIEQTLNDLGIFHFDQLAKLSKANIDWIEDHLAFKGRIAREAWVEQAKALTKPKKSAK